MIHNRNRIKYWYNVHQREQTAQVTFYKLTGLIFLSIETFKTSKCLEFLFIQVLVFIFFCDLRVIEYRAGQSVTGLPLLINEENLTLRCIYVAMENIRPSNHFHSLTLE